MAAGLADVVHGVGQLEGASALGSAEDVAPLVADVSHDDVPSVLQLLPLARLVGHRGTLEPWLLKEQVTLSGDVGGEEVGNCQCAPVRCPTG